MPTSLEDGDCIQTWARRNVLLIIWVIISALFVASAIVGGQNFNKNNAVSIYSSIIQGVSALLGVAIAVIIFRIQALENRNLALEQSTLNYIYQITHFTYPQWIPSVEAHIENAIITNRYYDNRVQRARANGPLTPNREQVLKDDRDAQQRRLMEVLNLHRKTTLTIRRTRRSFLISTAVLVTPILLSLLMLMVSDALNSSWNFFVIALVIMMSASGIILLTKVVLVSTVELIREKSKA